MYVVNNSGKESDLAKKFEKMPHVKVYAKLPEWVKIETPLEYYNPDWASGSNISLEHVSNVDDFVDKVMAEAG